MKGQADRIASAAVYAAIDHGSPKVPWRPQKPLLPDSIERWLALKIDVSPTTMPSKPVLAAPRSPGLG